MTTSIFATTQYPMETQLIILDFGSQYTQLIARRIRECGVYCEILPYTKLEEALKAKAVILSGSPFSRLEDNAPTNRMLRKSFPTTFPV